MTIFSLQKFHQKAKNPRKRPIVSKFDVPKVPELYGCPGSGSPAAFDSEHDENTSKFDFDYHKEEKIKNHKLSEICNYLRYTR